MGQLFWLFIDHWMNYNNSSLAATIKTTKLLSKKKWYWTKESPSVKWNRDLDKIIYDQLVPNYWIADCCNEN